VTPAAGLLALPLWLAAGAAGAPGLDAAPDAQKIAVEVRGPVALVTVTRPLACEPAPRLYRNGPPVDEPFDKAGNARLSCEQLIDVALPEGAALVDVAVSQHGKWAAVPVASRERAAREYLAAAPFPPARESYDDGTTFRARVAMDRTAAVVLRYRFSLLPETSDGRRRIRFPGSPERQPVPADVTTSIAGSRDVVIGGSGGARARISTRSGWEISWTTTEAPRARLDGGAAFAKVSTTETLAAVSVEARGDRPTEPPPSLLFVVDRSRSVGLAGLAAENDLAGRLLEALPPSTRFDVVFFDRQVRRLFPMTRPATREALSALDAEMVPDRMRNGTDLAGALREAGALLRRETSAFAPRAWLVLLTDGALPETDGAALDAALGATPGIALQVAAFVVRPADEDRAPPAATRALRRLTSARGGLLRELAANELGEALPAALAALSRGGDVAEVRLVANGAEHAIAPRLAPGEGRQALLSLPTFGANPAEVVGTANGARVHRPLHPRAVDATWLSALAPRPAGDGTRFLRTSALVAFVETPTRTTAAADAVRGRLDREVVRNTLALAYMPRARACYLNRTAATPAERDLAGRVRLAIDFTRGEVGTAVVQSSTLNHPAIEACLRDGAFELEVPRTLRSDSPTTAILNLVFRPRTPEKHENAAEAALGAQIDLVIEELHRTEPAAPNETGETPPADRSMIPTR
jgi:Mg-chelatase subunit ChlD